MCTQYVLLYATCVRVQGNMSTQNVLLHATFARTQYAHAQNMCTRARATCLHILHARFSRVHMYVSSYGSSYRPTCARNMCTCTSVFLHEVYVTCSHGTLEMCTCVCRDICTCMGLALGLAMNQHLYATCVVARSISALALNRSAHRRS